MSETSLPLVFIRGVHAAALTKLLSAEGFVVVPPSSEVAARFNIRRSFYPDEVSIEDREDGQAVVILGAKEAVATVIAVLQQKTPGAVVRIPKRSGHERARWNDDLRPEADIRIEVELPHDARERIFRIGVISDTHVSGIEDLPRGLVELLSDLDIIVHLGDYTGKGLLDALRALGEFRGVCGNMDPMSIKMELPEKEVFEIGGRRIGLIHGSGGPGDLATRVRNQFHGVDAILYGHSHLAYSETVGGLLCLNPGSATGRMPAPGKTLGIITVGHPIRGEIIALP